MHETAGFNRRLDTLQAAVLRVKLRRLDAWNEARRQHAALYAELLAGAGVERFDSQPWAEHVWHLYAICTEERDALKAFLEERGIETGIHYPVPIHLQQAFRHLGYSPGSFPVTEAMADRLLSLPMFPELQESQIRGVVDALAEFSEHRIVPEPASATKDESSRAA